MTRPPSRSTLTHTLFPYTTLFRFGLRRAGAGAAPPESYTLAEKLSGLLRTLPFLAIIVAVTVFMYGGFATPSEVAAIAAFLALVLVAVVYRGLRLADLWAIMRDATRESSMILLLIAATRAEARRVGKRGVVTVRIRGA